MPRGRDPLVDNMVIGEPRGGPSPRQMRALQLTPEDRATIEMREHRAPPLPLPGGDFVNPRTMELYPDYDPRIDPGTGMYGGATYPSPLGEGNPRGPGGLYGGGPVPGDAGPQYPPSLDPRGPAVRFPTRDLPPWLKER